MTIEATNRIMALPEVLNAFGFYASPFIRIDRDWAEMVVDTFEHSMNCVVSINYLLYRVIPDDSAKGYREEPKIIEITDNGYYAFRAPLKEELEGLE